MVYSARVGLPPSSTKFDDKFKYVSHHTPIPNFEGRENCTFTVRVPRYYLSAEQRELVCRQKCLWGTEVYTDDSDTLAAAVHGGWIRGEWGEGVDVGMLELGGTDAEGGGAGEDGEDDEDAEREIPRTMDKPLGTGPVVPPEGMDAHITLLVLPTLQKYESTVQKGIMSRKWKDHDGMSFMIMRVEWVDESGDRGEERDGEARRKRLRAAMGLVSLFEGSGGRTGAGGGMTKNHGFGMVGRVAETAA